MNNLLSLVTFAAFFSPYSLAPWHGSILWAGNGLYGAGFERMLPLPAGWHGRTQPKLVASDSCSRTAGFASFEGLDDSSYSISVEAEGLGCRWVH